MRLSCLNDHNLKYSQLVAYGSPMNSFGGLYMTMRCERAIATLNVHVRTCWNGLNGAAEKRQLHTTQMLDGKTFNRSDGCRWLQIADKASCAGVVPQGRKSFRMLDASVISPPNRDPREILDNQ